MKTLLLIITCFIGITAIICGIMIIAEPNGSSLELSLVLLNHTPFNDFLIPGYVLLVVVGGSNAIAAFTLMVKQKNAFNVSITAGLFISGWIVVQVIITGLLFWLQFVFLGAGISILLISFHLKEKALL
jgi:hypothetical protein